LQAGLASPTNDLLRYELKPSDSKQYRGAILRTNKLGMHDSKEYTTAPTAGTFRIAMVGASHAMGLGVEAGQTFEALIEERLNRENGKAGRTYEFLNFSVTGYEPVRQIVMLQKKVFEFKPNVVIFAGHHGDAERCVHEVMLAVRDGIELPDARLQEIVARSKITAETPEPLMRRKLKPYTDAILSTVFDRIVALCREHGAEPCYILLPLAPGQPNNPLEVGPDLELAGKAGFNVIDLSDAYEGHPWQSLWISEFDTHPNVLGHELLAKRLYQRLVEKRLIPVD
jgi:hypothetical protein